MIPQWLAFLSGIEDQKNPSFIPHILCPSHWAKSRGETRDPLSEEFGD